MSRKGARTGGTIRLIMKHTFIVKTLIVNYWLNSGRQSFNYEAAS
jgi:hypothetical protein